MLGAIFVVLIIFAFLRSWRSTLIICTSIPISIIGTFALLYFGGYTLNTMTFGGLALGVGMIVDASIVVLENTQRHLEMGKSRTLAAIEGSEEIWSAILASTLTHIAVFVPLFFLTGFSSVLFKQLSVVVVFSLAMSLFVAVTLVPVLCSLLMTEHTEEPSHGHHRLALPHQRQAPRWHRCPLRPHPARRAQAPADRPRRGHGVVRARHHAVSAAHLRADAADRRGRGPRGHRAAGRHPHRGDPGGDSRDGGTHPQGRAGDGDHHLAGRRWRLHGRREHTSRRHHRPADQEGRAHAVQRDDRGGSAAAAHRHAGRHRALACLWRLAAQSHPRGQPGRTALAGDSRLRLRRRTAAGAGVGGPAAHGARHRRRAQGPRGRPARAGRACGPRQGRHLRTERHGRGRHAAHERGRYPGGVLPGTRTGVPDRRPPAPAGSRADFRRRRRAPERPRQPRRSGAQRC